MGEFLYRSFLAEEIDRELFRSFRRYQVVTDCLRKVNGTWIACPAPFIDDWTEKDYAFLIQCLRRTVLTGGLVCGGFMEGKLKGFVSVEPGLFGCKGEYLDLSSLHVSVDCRRQGVGQALFTRAANWAREKGARKLYISAHSAVESQAFYRAMGCVDAMEINEAHVQQEPYDRQMEFNLKEG